MYVDSIGFAMVRSTKGMIWRAGIAVGEAQKPPQAPMPGNRKPGPDVMGQDGCDTKTCCSYCSSTFKGC